MNVNNLFYFFKNSCASNDFKIMKNNIGVLLEKELSQLLGINTDCGKMSNPCVSPCHH